MRDYAELVKRLKESDDNCHAECYECPGECLSSGCNIFSEAADAIEELVATVPKWISVEERLPETDDFVVVAVLDERGDTPYQYTDFGWYLDAASCWIVNAEQRRDITHWMPLHAPPKEVV